MLARNNISTRYNLWKSIIYKETYKINQILFNINDNNNDDVDSKLNNIYMDEITEYEYSNCVSFITNWNGLKLKEYEMPKTAKKYQQKSRSWLNGRRAMQYAKYLYPIMIEKAESV